MLIFNGSDWLPFRAPTTPKSTPAVDHMRRVYIDMLNERTTIHNQIMALSQRFGRNLDYVPRVPTPY